MAIVSLAVLGEAAGYQEALTRLLQPFAQMFSPAPASLIIYLGELYPAGPEVGVNPHPALVKTFAEWAYEAGATEIKLAARAAPGFIFNQSWQLAGYDALASCRAAVLDLQQSPQAPRFSRLSLTSREFMLPQPLLQADCLVNMGKFRAADSRLFGSALKNLAALTDLPQTEEFSRALVDLYDIAVPDLHIIDALRGHRGWQPLGQDALLAAADATALDLTLAALAALPGDRIEEIALAAQYGLGSTTAADIALVGDAPALFNFKKIHQKGGKANAEIL
jgi:uncharacterized protein (DUF362 family)